MDVALRRFRFSMRALTDVFANRDLARLVLAWGAFTFAGWAFAIALSVYAFHHGEIWAVGIAAAARQLAGGLASPFSGLMGDRFSRRLVLVGSALLGAIILGICAYAVDAHWPSEIIYALGALSTVAVSPYVPAEGALLPQVARTPQELSAANVAHNEASNLGFLTASLAIGVLMSAVSLGSAFIAAAAAGSLASLLLFTLRKDAPPRYEPDQTASGMLRELALGFKAVHSDRKLRLLDNVMSVNDFIEGVANVMVVIIALDLLGRGEGTVGYLHASWAIGALIAGGVLAVLARRGNLTAAIATGCLITGTAFALPGLWPSIAVAYISFMLVGYGYASVKVTGRTLMQRLGDPETLARAIAFLETNRLIAMALGSLAAPALVELIGIRPALFFFGGLVATVALVRWRALRVFEIGAPVSERHYELLRGTSIFAPLPVETLEGVTHALVEVEADAGQEVTTQGDRGDRFYVIEDGEVEVFENGLFKRRQGEGQCFGEIALIRDVRRTATVRATRTTRLVALSRHRFIEAVAGHRRSSHAAATVASGWLTAPAEEPPLKVGAEASDRWS
ncbi:MAG: transporter [Solirubrobacterales bacterium]|jgi:MFS family permease|nr:transporter [Solirubrobacterales bacterium]